MSHVFDRQYGRLSHQGLLLKLKNSASITKRLILDHTLNFHRGCVNTICWNQSGTTILSGSDDQHLIVTDPFATKILTKVHSGHRENIFSAKFLPGSNDERVVSCSGDGVLFHTNLTRGYTSHSNEGCFTCHGTSTAYEVRVIPQTPDLFLSCSDDGTIRLFDLRTKSQCLKDYCNDDILIRSQWGITSMDINPMNSNEIVCSCGDSSIRLYDHRRLSSQVSSLSSISAQSESSLQGLISCFTLSNQKQPRRPRVTSVVFNAYGSEILASYSSESIYLLDPKQNLSQEQIKQRLTEHRKAKRSNAHEREAGPKSAAEQTATIPQVKRLRLGGDWSDTGPDARPSSEADASESTNHPVDPSDDQQESARRGRNLQNSFMQRMSDIFTQLVTHTTSATEQTSDELESRDIPDTTQSGHVSPSRTTDSRPTQNSSVSSASATDESRTANQNVTEGNTSERPAVFDFLVDDDRVLRTPEDDDDDQSSMDDEADDDHANVLSSMSSSAAAAANDSTDTSERRRRTMMFTKGDRIRKRRETERSHEESFLRNASSLGLLNSYDGHRNARTMIKEANFWSDNYVMSGSDCGHIFIWDKVSGEIMRIIPADEHVVNCVQPHPLNYPILASSGIDYNIKLFSPLSATPIDDSELIHRTVIRNHAMAEETSSTITVPATFMFRILTSMYRLQHSDDMFGFDDEDDDE